MRVRCARTPPKGRVPKIRTGAACSLQQPAAAYSSLQQQPAGCSLQLQQNVLLQAGCRLQSAGCNCSLQQHGAMHSAAAIEYV